MRGLATSDNVVVDDYNGTVFNSESTAPYFTAVLREVSTVTPLTTMLNYYVDVNNSTVHDSTAISEIIATIGCSYMYGGIVDDEGNDAFTRDSTINVNDDCLHNT